MLKIVKRVKQFSVSDETLPYLADFLQDNSDTYSYGVALFEILNNSKINENNLHLLWKALINDVYPIVYKEKEILGPLSQIAVQIAWKGDPATAAFDLYKAFGYPIEWMTNVLENMKIGIVSFTAYRLCFCEKVTRAWAEEIIENSKEFDRTCVNAAVFMYQYCGSSKKWAETIIEKARCGDPGRAALYFKNVGWIKKVIEEAKSGDPSFNAATFILEFDPREIEWAKRIIENDTIGSPAFAAAHLCQRHMVPLSWAEKIVENNPMDISANQILIRCGSTKWKST